MTQSDHELLDRFRACRDATAFSEIVRRYASMVYSAGRRIVRDSGLAEDVAQETFFRLMRRPERVTQSLGGWLHRSATRLAVDARRSNQARLRRERLHGRVGNDPSWTTISRELDEAIAAIPDASRELLVRHFLQGESQENLAIDLSASPATVSRRMKVAIEELRMEMRRRGVDACPLTIGTVCARHAVGTSIPQTLSVSLGKMSIWCAARSMRHSRTLPRALRAMRRIAPRARLVRAGGMIVCAGFAFLLFRFCAQRIGTPQSPGDLSSAARTHWVER